MNIFISALFLNLSLNPNPTEINFTSTRFINTSNKIIACNFHGTRSEGWYAYPLDNEIVLKKGPCDFEKKPECIDLKNGMQAWLIDGITVASQCIDRDAVCSYRKTTNEGWYSYPSEQRSLISYTFCSDK